MSYYTESLKTHSEKITLVTLEAVERLKLFNLNGSDYERIVENMVVGVKDSGVALPLGTLPLSLNEWFFEPTTKTLTVNVGADPKTKDISATYRLFFSNAPMTLPYDLATGHDVEWEPYINSISSIGQQLDAEQTGVVLESSSSVDFINTDGRWDLIFDKYIFENQEIKFYSWFPNIPISERVQLFSGVIESKSFSDSKVSLKVKDFVYKLKNKLNLGLFSESDGTILPSLIGTAKRRIYGQADYVKTASLDAILDGYSLVGTVSGTLALKTITGIGTLFLDEVSTGDELFITINETEYKIGVEFVVSDTEITTSNELQISFSSESIKNKPAFAWRKKNRDWHLAGHKLRAPESQIITVNSSNSFVVNTALDMFAGDEITVNGIPSTIRRISGSTIVTSTNIVPIPVANDLINKRAIKSVYFGSKKLEYSRDYLFTNTTLATINIDELAEFNITEQSLLDISLTFTNGSREITTTATTDLKAALKPRDWIRSDDPTKPDWYEIIHVNEQSVIIREPFAFSNETGTAYYKNIETIDENSLITASCLGMEVDGQWMKTASDCVRNLVLVDAEFASVDETSFAKAKADCDYIVSMVIPESLGQGYPIVRDIISKLNESILAVLYGNSTQEISYSIFNTRKPTSLAPIKDDDILSFSAQSNQNIINEARILYSPYVDVYSNQEAFKVTNKTSSFVNNLIGIKATLEKKVYLYEQSRAEIMAQRLLFFRSLSNSIITITAKMNLSSVSVNDKMLVSLDRLFKRYSSTDKRRIGVVSGVKKDGFGVEISLSDLSNCFNRVMCIAPNTTLDYLSASDDDKISWCFIVDGDTKTPNPLNEDGLGSNLIG